MPRRPPFRDVSEQQPPATRTVTHLGLTGTPLVGQVSVADLRDGIEHVRQGTREQWESDWVQIPSTGSFAFKHELGEIPWVVDVIGSYSADGKAQLNRNASVTVSKTDTTITVTNNTTVQYFKVRAM